MFCVKIDKEAIFRFVISVFAFVALSFFIRFFASSSKVLFSHYSDVLKAAVCGSFVLHIWNYNKDVIKTFLMFSFLYELPAFFKLFNNMPLTGTELADSFCFANLICSVILLLLKLVRLVRNRIARKICIILVDIIIFLAILLPVFHIGYYLLSGQVLSAAIVLTLFQTNSSEVISYLKDQNLITWGLGIFGSLALCVFVVLFLNRIEKQFDLKNKNRKRSDYIVGAIITVVLTVLGFKAFINIIDNVYTVTVFKQTQSVLKEYSDYKKAKVLRSQNLKKLQGLGIKPAKGGVYVLVIGESETRDHMNVYGYERENTPWLSEMSKSKETILFTNAYSNHTHTVPVLTYALSEKNQYNNISLKHAYSIMEVAKAAGYKTVWISNQIKYGAWDTPTAEMASTADREIWLNGNVGRTVLTQYYDEEIATQISQLNFEKDKNVFIVCHLMGCHGFYRDRYPERFAKFKTLNSKKEQEENVLYYDNSVYYNDFVLEKIYEAIKRNENFKAMIYLSDHGEEPDQMKGHEASKFTWQMTRIPFVMFFSKEFLNTSAIEFRNLSANKEKFWTNDLLYNALIDIMGIQNVPHRNDIFNIASDKYNLNRKQLKTLHGKKKLDEEILKK